MDDQERRRLRHDLRGQWNAIRLCLAALPHSQNPAEVVEMLDGITTAASQMEVLAARVMDLPE